MSKQDFGNDPLDELRAMAAAAEALAAEPKAFHEAFEAFRARDAARFQDILDRLHLGRECERICFLFCQKHCVGLCVRLCPDRPRPVDTAEVLEFVHAFARVAADPEALAHLAALAEREDVEAWQVELKRLKLDRFCHQVCHFLCRERCRRVCRDLCARPLITRVSAIPVAQIGPLGLGNGPSIPPFQVPAPNPAAGVGDHPVGGSSWLMGIFNMPTATQYKVEVAAAPAGPYAPIAVPVEGYISAFPYIPVTRYPSGGPDPGWYNVSEIPLSDGGPSPLGRRPCCTGPRRPTAPTTCACVCATVPRNA
ncbi:MAG: hypothetical protein HY355_06205 [Armatimonadetes bacterium]|nr:hypothetical protein [Armatimonadota bacterium]